MTTMPKKWLQSDLALLVRRMAALYAALAICRAAFLAYNADLVGRIAADEVWMLVKGSLVFDTVSILYINALFIVLSLLPFRFRGVGWYRGALFAYYMVVNGTAVCVNLADAVYFHYAQKRLTAEEAFYADNDNSGQLIAKFAGENWYMLLLAALIIWALWAAYGRRKVPSTPISGPWAYFAFSTATLLGASALIIGGIRGGFTRMTRPITLSNASAYCTSPTKANLILSNPFCMLRTLGNKKITYTKYYTQEELERIYTPYHRPAPGVETEVSLEGYNVMVFILESFSAEHSALLNPDLYPDGKGFTPCLDSLMRNSITFTECYSNGRKSIEALPSVLSSIPSFKTPFVLMPQSLGRTEALPEILFRQGYSTAFFCGSSRGSMGFGAYAASAGIRNIYGREDYEKRHGGGQFDNYWGIWDEPFLQYVGEELDAMPQPFMAAVFTLSSHHPFVVPAQYADSLPAGRTKVHKGVAYTDMAIRRFFERYADSPWMQNTAFVFSADHVSSEVFADKTRTPTGNMHIIGFIHSKANISPVMHRGVAQQIDLMPTLLGLMNYGKPYFAFGRDIFREPERPAVAINYVNQNFQAVTDSTVVFFDEKNIKAAYARKDTLQKHDISKTPDTGIAQTTDYLKAFIQQYYSHAEAGNFITSAE